MQEYYLFPTALAMERYDGLKHRGENQFDEDGGDLAKPKTFVSAGRPEDTMPRWRGFMAT